MTADTLLTALIVFAGLIAACIAMVWQFGLRSNRRRAAGYSDTEARCVMCRRSFPEEDLNRWKIRDSHQLVCTRCHPFYKDRFGGGKSKESSPVLAGTEGGSP